MYSFEKLECWQHARLLAGWVYKITEKFPSAERFGLMSQMQRAAISIASNIAEGTSRKTSKGPARFSTIAYSSAVELLNQLIISNDLHFVSGEHFEEGRKLIEKQTLLIAFLRRAQQKSITH
ncbi:four helix bundle protein [Ferruginibacter sp. HRS2-29]|nr:four helix bundle protein [Ferruginibacter sp. HRS2-29]